MLGIIAGTGLNQWQGAQLLESAQVETPYGAPSAELQVLQIDGHQLVFLPRHGVGHTLPPHAINYRANVFAMKQFGVTQLVGVAAVGGISAHMAPAELVLPHDLIDYSWGRAHSYSLNDGDPLRHVEFAPPYNQALREHLLAAARSARVNLREQAVHGITQGPRLETTAEVRRLARDGCDIVGMTGMPEAGLAAELDLPYACLAVVVNWAAGIGREAIHAEIEEHISAGMEKARQLITQLCGNLG